MLSAAALGMHPRWCSSSSSPEEKSELMAVAAARAAVLPQGRRRSLVGLPVMPVRYIVPGSGLSAVVLPFSGVVQTGFAWCKQGFFFLSRTAGRTL